MFAKPCNRQCQQTQCRVSPTHRDSNANAQPMPSHIDVQAIASPMPSHRHASAKPMHLLHRTIRECQATSALEPTCPTRAACAHQGSPTNCYGDKHCKFTFLPNALSNVKLRATIQKATDVGTVGQKTMQRLALVAEPLRTLHWTAIH